MALYKESHNIKVFEPNEITLNAVQGEGNEREYEFRLIEKSGDTLKTSNAQVTDKMLDVTGCSVRLYVAKPDGHIVYMDGSILDAPGGIISFTPKQQVFTADGKANCVLQITSANGDLRAIGVTLNIGKANIDEALESKDELTALMDAVTKAEKIANEVADAVGKATDSTEVVIARGNELTLDQRLEKIEAGERILSAAITEEKLSGKVLGMFMEPAPDPINLYDPAGLTKGKYYVSGVLTSNSVIDSLFFDVSSGDKVYASGFKFTSQYSKVGAGARIAMFEGDTWKQDLSTAETAMQDYVMIPDGITRISVPFWQDDPARTFCIYSSPKGAIQKVNELDDRLAGEIKRISDYLEDSVTLTEEHKTYQNLYDKTEILKGQYYSGGKLVSLSYADTMPLLSVNAGDHVYTSAFSFPSQYNSGKSGIRVGLFYNDTWVKDLIPAETKDVPYIEIPSNVNQIAAAFWADDSDRKIYNLTSGVTEDETVKTPVKEVVKTILERLNSGSALSGKRVSILGDSISTFAGYIPDGNRARYPQSNLLTDVELTWWKRLVSEYGMELGVNESWAGSLVSWNGTAEGQDVGAEKHIASVKRIRNLGNNGVPDYIFVFGGTNDVSTKAPLGTFDYGNDPSKLSDEQIGSLPVTTFADAYRTMLIRLLKWYPRAKVVCILPLYTSQTDGANLDKYDEIIKEACDFFGVPVVDTRSAGITIFNRSLYLPDGIHPNAAGMELICNCIQKELF